MYKTFSSKAKESHGKAVGSAVCESSDFRQNGHYCVNELYTATFTNDDIFSFGARALSHLLCSSSRPPSFLFVYQLEQPALYL